MENLGESLWWRAVPLAAGFVVNVLSVDTGLFGLVPIVLWIVLARSWRTGLVVGLLLVTLLAWFVLPRAMELPGRWVPSALEVYWLHPMIAAVVIAVGLLVERRLLIGVLWLPAMIVAGMAIAVFLDIEASMPRDEGVVSAASGLEVAEDGGRCGSGHGANCARELTATGDRAAEVVRAGLASGGFTYRPPLPTDERLCRQTGLVLVHEVCAELRHTSPTSVRVLWYVNRSAA
ncbi:hypothetical protein AB0M48_21010 [Lentzea sp. NPDC051208]|uniref:hypothetical protein n=1 Tax=Lentzea sp. NPDC051208 TaxID=3154642 RepID=UPI00343BE676